MQGDLIPKLVSLSHLNELQTAHHQWWERILLLRSASSVAGRASANRSMIVLDFIIEVAKGNLILKLHFIFGWKSKQASPNYAALLQQTTWLCCCPQPQECDCLP